MQKGESLGCLMRPVPAEAHSQLGKLDRANGRVDYRPAGLLDEALHTAVRRRLRDDAPGVVPRLQDAVLPGNGFFLFCSHLAELILELALQV